MLVEGCFYLYNRYKNGKIGIEKRQGGGGRFLAPVPEEILSEPAILILGGDHTV